MSTWTEHVSAALLGTRRRSVPALPPLTVPPLEGVPDAGTSGPGMAESRTDADGLRAGDGPGGAAGSGRAGVVGAGEAAPEADPAWVLLEQAAVLAVRRRAGRRAGTAGGYAVIAPAPGETTPMVPPAAARRLARILSGDQLRLLPEWLDAAAGRGLRVPPGLLPDLLERGRADRSLRPSIVRAAGRRGVWLALRNTDWAYLVSEGSDPGDDDPEVWQTGTRNQRVAYLTRLRGHDPAAARRTLRETWAGEPAPDRAAFLATLEHGLSPADEPFLEEALGDRAKDVRRLAADLLARLPGSAYAHRMAERARTCLWPQERTVRGRRQTWIVVEPPHAHDEEMARDGIPFHPAGSFAPGGRSGSPVGTRAGWLREILARTPLETWTDLLGRPPMEVVCLPVTNADREPPGRTAAIGRREDRPAGAPGAGGSSSVWADAGDEQSARDVHVGWIRAAVRQRDAQWARALLRGGVVPADEAEALADLLEVLPPAERDSAAADLVRWLDGSPELLRLLDRMPGPWAGRLADAVIELLAAAALDEGGGRGGRHGRMLAPLCRLADARLAPDTAPRLDEVARRHGDLWPLRELTDTLRFRHEMLQELT
ncbi:hypothetical protein SAMN04489712_10357 [Thermomonospora echinospora]|uniref:Uncharacterized protein n=1 Tax=Thermomonospora echinospora TaxID=1992 RepID=A0A1H5X1M4_9ACTN|nr:DUF5691 domain-containing protein [Thermomonospora echinospora]SEG05799.1 hypothetical protein SAMN04489712_10357 [Thermomonospora echinospora]